MSIRNERVRRSRVKAIKLSEEHNGLIALPHYLVNQIIRARPISDYKGNKVREDAVRARMVRARMGRECVVRSAWCGGETRVTQSLGRIRGAM